MPSIAQVLSEIKKTLSKFQPHILVKATGSGFPDLKTN
jgi:hypothetical protein